MGPSADLRRSARATATSRAIPYPKIRRGGRRDAWPPGGGLPAATSISCASSTSILYGIEHGILNPLSPTGQGDQNDEFSAAMAAATNEWQLEAVDRREPRLKASVVVPYEDAQAARAEIERAPAIRASRRCCAEPHRRAARQARYWPIYEAAVEAGLRSASTCSATAAGR